MPQEPNNRTGQTYNPPSVVPDDEDAPGFIDVPEGYQAGRSTTGDYGYERRGPGGRLEYQPHVVTTNQNVRPTYQEGAEFGYAYGLSPAQLAQLQRQLTNAGLLDPETYVPGFIGGGNDPTLEAVRTIMGYANRAGYTTVEDALRAYIASGQGALGQEGYGGGAGGRQPRLPAPVTNADELRQVFRAAVIDTLGTGWSEAQINAMVADYQAHERAYNGQIAAAGTVDEQMASPETFAVNRAVETDPTAAQGQQFLAAANDLTSMLGRWSG